MSDAPDLADGPPLAPRSNRRRVWLATALAGLIAMSGAFLAGRFVAVGATPDPLESSAEAGFARDMQVHHAQAVEMAMIVYPVTQDPEIRAIAYDVATGQSAQRGQMYQWLADWGLPQAGGAPMAWMQDAGEHGHGATAAPLDVDEAHAAMGMATAAQLDALRAAEGTAADCQFLALMIPHHEGATSMIDAVLDLGEDPDVLRTAASMAATQGAEIDAMAAIQTRLGCAAEPIG